MTFIQEGIEPAPNAQSNVAFSVEARNGDLDADELLQIAPLSVRLDEETEQRLTEACRRYGLSKSEAVKRSLADWLAGLEPAPDAYELGTDLFDEGSAAQPPDDPLRQQIWE